MKKEVKSSLLLIFLSIVLHLSFNFKVAAFDENMLTILPVGESCAILDCDDSVEGAVVIPAEISGKKVTHIYDEAFSECKNITEVVLPDSITEIGDKAFYSCVKLSRLTMTDSVKTIGQGAFSRCSSLEKVILSDNLDVIAKDLFYMCSSLTDVNIPQNVRSIGENAFSDCSKLSKLVLPEGLLNISLRSFSGCSQLTSVCLPSSLNSIGAYVFEKCTSLFTVYYMGDEDSFKQINVSRGNEFLDVIDIKFNHNHINQADVTTVKPDCTKGGYSIFSCPCGYSFEDDYTSPTGHSLTFTSTVEEATCTKEGSQLYSCSACDYVEVRAVSPKGHIEVKDKEVKPDCTNPGKTAGSHCSRCNAVMVEQQPISASGHDFTLKLKDNNHLASKATYAKAAKYYYSCSRCKTKISNKTFSGDKLVLPSVKKLDFTAGETTVTLKWKSIKAARGYAVYKKDSKGKWKLIERIRTNSYTVKKLKAGKSYTYAVRAYVIENKKIIYAPAYTSIKTVTVPLPSAKITAKQNEKSISLSWKKAEGATGYRVYRYDTKKEKWVTVCSYTKKNKYTLKNLTSGKGYKLAVASCIKLEDKLLVSKKSESLTVCTKPSRPVIKSTSYAKAVKLEWNKIKYADGYVIYASEDSNSGYKKVASTKKRSAKINNLERGKYYYFKVYSYRKFNGKTVYSYASEIKKVKTR